MPVDSFKWLPRSIAGYYQSLKVDTPESISWTPLAKSITQCRVALVTTAGIHVAGDQPFDLDRERREPFWGDPTFRVVPKDIQQEDVRVDHLHINTEDIEQDINVALPVDRIAELVDAREVGSLAEHHYSFMGYQQNTGEWAQRYGPEVAQRMKEEEVDAALITPV